MLLNQRGKIGIYGLPLLFLLHHLVHLLQHILFLFSLGRHLNHVEGQEQHHLQTVPQLEQIFAAC